MNLLANTPTFDHRVMENRQEMRSGVTLIEVLVSTILISGVLLTSLAASANLWRSRIQSHSTAMAAELSESILGEITSRRFEDSVDPIWGHEADENGAGRSAFDDIDDYHEYTASPPVHRDGTTMTDYAGWSVSITVEPAWAIDTGITSTPPIDSGSVPELRSIMVTCVTPTGDSITESVVASNVPTQTESASQSYQWQSLRMSLPSGRSVKIQTPLRNLPTAEETP
ncbi:type IV pilus modification PilV family protein [Rubripirellula reticaptiva]|uniref:Pseudopilin GspJ n=1 Tax=Rubripirellula reticaptiva TaxID=2528013 RepID=A0A5C6EMN0_9BACT|nr:hypothetical protein [Rubripirellula reticaptiva]TWU49397.1 hypothetical protein Poly59_40120 [Rubripirellula reticaptiva]